jgi:hypothetical protein
VARLAVIWSVGIAAMAATALAWPRLRRDIHAVIDMARAARKSPRAKRAAGPETDAPSDDFGNGPG